MKICRFCQQACFVPIPPAAPMALVAKLPRRVTHVASCAGGQEWEMSKFDVCLSIIQEAINAAEKAEKGSPRHDQTPSSTAETI